MKNRISIFAAAGICVLAVTFGWTGNAGAQSRKSATQADIAALLAEIDALKRVVPSQSHAMKDVEYHFSSLWFAAQSANWPLAAFYLNEAKSNLNWAVRIRPVRKLSTGQPFDLQPMLQGIENASFAQLKSAIDQKDARAFETAYRQGMTECHACHKLAEKPFLRPHIPEVPAATMIDMKPGTD